MADETYKPTGERRRVFSDCLDAGSIPAASTKQAEEKYF